MVRHWLSTFGVTLFVVHLAGPSAEAQVWTNIGPEGGSVQSVFASPSQPNTILAAGLSNQGGLFKTTDGGTLWQSVSAGLSDVHVVTVAFHPTDPDTIYVGTSHGGICRSVDGGATWTVLNTGLALDANGYPRQVDWIVIDPSAPLTLNAAQEGAGFLHSTNGGSSWTQSNGNLFVVNIAVAPSSHLTLYASAIDSSSGPPQYVVLKSGDGGASWAVVNNTLGTFGAISVDPTASNIAYMSSGTIYKTVDGGTTWTPANVGLLSSLYGVTQVVFDPANPNTLFAAAIGSCLCRSTNGGGSWAPLSTTGLPSWVVGLVIDRNVPGRMEAATNSGVYRSTDSGSTWTAANSGLTLKPVTALALTQDTHASALFSTVRADTSAAEIWKIPGDSGTSPAGGPVPPTTSTISSIVVDPFDANAIYVLTCADLNKTTNGGGSWTSASSGAPLGSGVCGTTLVPDPSTTSRLYLTLSTTATTGLYRTTTGGASWTPAGGLPAGKMNAVAVSNVHSNVLYASGLTNKVYKSTDSGATWTAASTGLPSGTGSFAGRLAIDPTSDDVAYVATSAGIFSTTTGGTSWSARTGGWPTLFGRLASAVAIVVDPTVPSTLYASAGTPVPFPSNTGIGTSTLGAGLYKSTDSGSNWTLIRETAGYIVTDIQIDGRRAAFAATNNGLLRLNLATTVAIDKTALVFGATLGGAAFAAATPPQTVRLTEVGLGGVPWTAKSDRPWLTVSPASGLGSGVLSVSVQFMPGLIGSQSGTITISAPGASNVVVPISVLLQAFGASASAPPFGSFDTPVDRTTGVAGSIAVTGWALDDVTVTGVRIAREPVAGEGTGLIFIGNAVQIDGARPDVAAAFVSTPRSSSAGWGYLLLTNFLPNQGNGTFRLHALVDDADGHSVDLGVKTITCANSTATAPFGAIDTPGQGSVVSGVVPNFGWTLIRNSGTPTPRADIPGGATVTVLVDGVAVGSPTGWASRSDLTALFPSGYVNLASTLAVFMLDTTTLTNGVHTIAWLVNATNGQSDGIGSRFFTVSNGASMAASALAADVGRVFGPGADAAITGSEDPASVPQPITGRRGFDLSAPYRSYYPEADGTIVVHAEELDRIELLVGADAGWLRTAQGLEPLPIGSHLDPATGTFTWAPGVGFVGAYDLVFAGRSPAAVRTNARIVLNPKGSNRVGPQIVIDTPRPGARVPQRFLLGGWAADLDAGSGTGIGALHVWAYPIAGGDPIFLGVAQAGDRPDVAAIYGDPFRDSGFGLIVDQLPPGTYDIAVFGWSLAKHGFLPAKIVRVTVR